MLISSISIVFYLILFTCFYITLFIYILSILFCEFFFYPFRRYKIFFRFKNNITISLIVEDIDEIFNASTKNKN